MQGKQPGSVVTPAQLDKLTRTAKPTPPPPTSEVKPSDQIVPGEIAAAVVKQDEGTAKKADEKKVPSAEEELKALQERLTKRLGIELTDKDFEDYVFRGRVIKKGITVSTGRVKITATFQTLTPVEMEQIDLAMAAVTKQGNRTEQGLLNENTLLTLARGWLEVNGKPLPKEPEDRRKAIMQFGNTMIDMVVECYQGFETLIRVTMREGELLKK